MRNQTEDSQFSYGVVVTCKLRVASVNRTNKNEGGGGAFDKTSLVIAHTHMEWGRQISI